MLTRSASLISLCMLASCLGTTERASIWPPSDFYLEVRGFETNNTGTHTKKLLQVWADGLVVYREAEGDLPGCTVPIPLFTEICAYRLDPASTRVLTRKLHQRHLFDLDEIHGENSVIDGEHAIIKWRARENHGSISSMSPTTNLDPVLNLINAYLPEGRSIGYAGLAGSPEDREIMRVPTPVNSLPGAMSFHVELADAHLEHEKLQLHTFALAVANEDWQEARKRLAIIETFPPSDILGEVLLDADWQRDYLDVLSALLKN